MPRNTTVRPIKQPDLIDHVMVSINAVESYDPETGHYGECRYAGCASMDRAKEIRQALYRAAKRVKPNEVSMAARIEPGEDGTFDVVYSAVNKAHARAYVLAKYGPDRSKWAYSPIRGDANYG